MFAGVLMTLPWACVGKSECAADRDSALTVDPEGISDLSEYAMRRADSVLSDMTVERKAAQLFMPSVYADSGVETFGRLREYARLGVGGIVLLKGNARSAACVSDSFTRMSDIPPFVGIDAEWGLAMRLEDTPRFPLNSVIGVHAGDSLMFEYGAEVARECRRLGINMVLGPVIDVGGVDTFIGKRSFGSDPQRVSDLAMAYCRGMVSGNVICVAKHFPGHGAASGDSHVGKPVIERSLHSLDSIDLEPFRNYIDQGLPAIMVGHIAFPAIDPDMLPAAVSKPVITDLLRNDMGFRGLVLTDAFNMSGAEGYGPEKAIGAGADMVLVPSDTYRDIGRILEALKSGELSESDLDDRVRRILFYKFLLGAGADASERGKAIPLPTEEIRRLRDALLR